MAAEGALPTPLAFERAGLQCWPGLEVEWDGSWVRRAANGYTQRANSVQCFDPTDDADVEARIAAAQEWYVARGLRPIFRINQLSGPHLLAALDAAGWVEVDHSQLMAMVLGQVAADPRGAALAIDDPAFLAAQAALKSYDAAMLDKLRAVLAVIEGPAAGIVLRSDDGRVVASSLMAVADGIVVTGNVETDARERRKGYGAAMMRTGLAWARAAGARFAALNVGSGNAAGQALYRTLGYGRLYDYSYRVPGAA